MSSSSARAFAPRQNTTLCMPGLALCTSVYRLRPAWLSYLRFPVGDMQKSDVYARAEELGLPAEELKESQEICFVSEGNYRSFVEREAPHAKRPGPFLDETGQPIGEHEGIAFYTRGQRRGLGVAAGRRLYVQTVVPQTNTVVLGPEETLLQDECMVTELNVFDDRIGVETVDAETKVRYATPSSPATLEPAIAFDPDDHRYLRIREDAGDLILEAAGDDSWEELYTTPSNFDVTHAEIGLEAEA